MVRQVPVQLSITLIRAIQVPGLARASLSPTDLAGRLNMAELSNKSAMVVLRYQVLRRSATGTGSIRRVSLLALLLLANDRLADLHNVGYLALIQLPIVFQLPLLSHLFAVTFLSRLTISVFRDLQHSSQIDLQPSKPKRRAHAYV